MAEYNEERFKSFLVEKPLYVKITKELPEHNYQLYPDMLLMDCSICKSTRPFHKPKYRKGIPWMGSIKTSIPKGDTSSINTDSESPSLKAGVCAVEYSCTGCETEEFWCWLEINANDNWIRKIGQVPPWSKKLDKNLEKFIDSQKDYFRKGLICESQGYGIGAYAYYRRIVENVIDDLLNSIETLIEPLEKEKYSVALEEVKKTIVAKEKIALIKDLLPPVLRPEGLNPLSILHSSLSDGIHNELDEKCLEFAQHIREVLVFLTNQITIHNESSKVFTESMRKILERKNIKDK
jgi:hypothetical protein